MREPTMTTTDDCAIADYTAFACHLPINPINPGGVAEWFKAPVLKTGRDESPSWVRIPPPPPASPRGANTSRELVFVLLVDSICIVPVSMLVAFVGNRRN